MTDRKIDSEADRLDAIVVGAGLAGLYALHKLRTKGLRAQVLEAGKDIGGTWFWNRYPGARCDVESLNTPTRFPRSCSRNGTGRSALPLSPTSCATSTMLRIDWS